MYRGSALLLSLVLIWLTCATPFSETAEAANETVNVWLTDLSGSARLSQQPALVFAPDSGLNPLTITVDENQQFQQMEGFGASFTDSSAWLVYNKMSAAQRNALMTSLFSSQSGIGLSMLRQPMGASDFTASGNYSYDDMPSGLTDAGLIYFSIGHDNAYIIPLLKQAIQLNPGLKIIGTPWSPPGWMKTSRSMIGGSLNSSAYSSLASYFVKYVQAYQAQAIPISYITVQNEPLFIPPNYPGMGMSSAEQALFIKNYLGPAFKASNIGTKILAYDHNWDAPSYPQAVLGDPGAAQYISGVAWHCYRGDPSAQTTVHNQFPDKGAFITECSGSWGNGDRNALQDEVRNLIINGSRNWAKSVILWNLALDTNNGPTSDDLTSRAVTTINQANGNVAYNIDYYALGHASKFVQPGAYRIGTNTFASSIENVAFKNPDGSKVLIAYNAGSSQSTFKVAWGNQSFSYTLNSGAAVTFTWSGAQGQAGQTLSRSGWVATASASNSGEPASNALDGNSGTRWSTGTEQSAGQFFQVDMRSPQTFNRIVMDAGASTGDYPRGYNIYVSNDGTNWGSPIGSGTGNSQLIVVDFPTQTARYIRVVQTGSSGNWWSISEFNVMLTAGASTSAPTLLTLTNTNRAAAFESVTHRAEPFTIANSYNFSSDQRTRVMLFGTGLELQPGENLSVITAQAVDARGIVYPLAVEYLGQVPGLNWLSSVVLKLPEDQTLNGDVSISVTMRGVKSNSVPLAIKAP